MQELTLTRRITIPDFGTPLTVSELIRLAEHGGSHFFDAGSRRFFRSRVYDGQTWHKPDGWVFITSEQFEDSMGRRAGRKYTVRSLVVEDGQLSINTLPNHIRGFQAFNSLVPAKRYAASLTSAHEVRDSQ